MSSVSVQEVLDAFPDLVEHLQGPKDVRADKPSSSAKPQSGGLCFCSDPKQLQLCSQAGLSILVVDKKLESKSTEIDWGKTALLTSPELQVAMAKLNQAFFAPQWARQAFADTPLHPSAVIHPSAELHPSVVVGPNSVIGPEVQVSENTVIGANTTLEGNIKIGPSCLIMSQVYIGHSVEIGSHCKILPQTSIGNDGFGYGTNSKGEHFAKPHFGKVILEDRVEIGSGVFMDRGTFEDSRIGEGTKIDNYCHLGHNLVMGKHCLVTAGLITAGSVTIGDHCVFGGRVSIAGHISICSHTMISPLAGVSKSINEPGLYGGFPPVPYKTHQRNQATTAHLAEMRKQISQLKHALEKLETDSPS